MDPVSQEGDRSEPRDEAAAGTHCDGGAGLVYWMLIGLSVATLAPCLILPAWRAYQSAEGFRLATGLEVERGAATIARLQRQHDALAADPGVIARLARRELAYREPGEEVVLHAPVDMLERLRQEQVDLPSVVPDVSQVAAVKPPVAVARLVRLLPEFDYDTLFCTSPNRSMLMTMACGLFLAAIIIFWPSARHDTPPLRQVHGEPPSTE
jgi:hypothetical protein